MGKTFFLFSTRGCQQLCQMIIFFCCEVSRTTHEVVISGNYDLAPVQRTVIFLIFHRSSFGQGQIPPMFSSSRSMDNAPSLPPSHAKTIDIVTSLSNVLKRVCVVDRNNHKEKNFYIQKRTTCQNSLNHDKCTKIIQLFPNSSE